MDKIELGNTSEFVSCMALGTMYFGTKTDVKTSLALLDLYSEYGGSFLDTANKYASWIPGFKGGESELLIGCWLKQKGNRSELFISSKVGFPYGDIPRSLKKELIISECEKSLKRLKTETIDLYFAHAFDVDTPAEESMEAFYQLKKSGKIRFAGASNHFIPDLTIANETAKNSGWEGFCCLQQRYTFLEPNPLAEAGNQVDLNNEQMDYCTNNQISIMAYSPLLGGFYGRKSDEIPDYYQSDSNKFRLKNLYDVAKDFHVSANTIVLAWMIQNAPKIIPIVACSSGVQMNENLEALSINLTKEHLEKLNSLEIN